MASHLATAAATWFLRPFYISKVQLFFVDFACFHFCIAFARAACHSNFCENTKEIARTHTDTHTKKIKTTQKRPIFYKTLITIIKSRHCKFSRRHEKKEWMQFFCSATTRIKYQFCCFELFSDFVVSILF